MPLYEVSRAVELVPPRKIAVAGLLAGSTEVGVEVAVRSLCGPDPARELDEGLLGPLVSAALRLPGEGLPTSIAAACGDEISGTP